MLRILKSRACRAILLLQLSLVAVASHALPLQLDFSGTTITPTRLAPNHPLGTPWQVQLKLDTDLLQLVRRIPGYNATYYAPLTSGLYGLGGRSATLDTMWLVVFDSLPNGADEIVFYGNAHGMNMFSLWLDDNTGRYWDAVRTPDLSQLTLSQFSVGKIAFDEDSPIVNMSSGSAAPYGVISRLEAHYVVPSPSSLSLLLLGICAVVGSVRRHKADA